MSKGVLIGGATLVGVILLFTTEILTFTTRGCTLPIDVVIVDTCIVGSIGMMLLVALAFGVVNFVWFVLKNLFR